MAANYIVTGIYHPLFSIDNTTYNVYFDNVTDKRSYTAPGSVSVANDSDAFLPDPGGLIEVKEMPNGQNEGSVCGLSEPVSVIVRIDTTTVSGAQTPIPHLRYPITEVIYASPLINGAVTPQQGYDELKTVWTKNTGYNCNIQVSRHNPVISGSGGGGGGTVDTASSAGGESLVLAKVTPSDLPFKGLVAGTNVTLTPTATTIEISAAAGGATTLEQLTDVNDTLAQTYGNCLTWDTASNNWNSMPAVQAVGTSSAGQGFDIFTGYNVVPTVGNIANIRGLIAGTGITVSVDGGNLKVTNASPASAATFAGLTDVSVTGAGVANQSLHFDAVTGKYTQTPELTIEQATRTVRVDTTGSVTLLSNLDASLASTIGEATVSGVSTTVEATGGNLGLNASGRVVVGGDTDALVGSANGSVEFQCALPATEYVKINTVLESAAAYSTKIQAFSDAVPNTQYVADAIAALGVSTLAGLTDVTLTAPSGTVSGGQALTYDGTKWINSTAIAAAAGDVVFTSDVRDVITQAGRDILLTADRHLTANITNQFVVNAADTILNSNFVILRPAAAASSYALISETNKDAAQYASDIAPYDAAIPNKKYVDTKVAASLTPVGSTYEYTVDTSAIVPPPASGRLIYNNATQTSATHLYFSHIDGTARDIEVLLALYGSGTKLIVQDAIVTANFQEWLISAVAVTAGSYVDYTVSLTASGGAGTTNFPNNTKILSFFITGSSGGAGTVTSVAALTLGTAGTDLSSTVANSTTTPVITLQVPTASAANRGALSAADWSTFSGKQNALTLTTTGTSGAATLISNTLNIPIYSSGGGSSGVVLASPYPIWRIGANITPATTQYYQNAISMFAGTAVSMQFMLYATGSDDFRLGIYRANTSWDILTAILVGQTAVTAATGLASDTIHSLNLTAESGQNLTFTAGEPIILCAYFDGTVASWKGSTITSSTVAWSNTTNLPVGLSFPTNPAAKSTNSGTTPFLQVTGTA